MNRIYYEMLFVEAIRDKSILGYFCIDKRPSVTRI